MSKHHHNQPAQAVKFPGDGPKETVFVLRRFEGQWQYLKCRIPVEVVEACVVDSRGPDLFGMCQSQIEYQMQRLVENAGE